MPAGAHAVHTFEGRAEAERVGVPEVTCHGGDRRGRFGQQVGGQSHTPVGQVGERRFAHQRGEPFGQCGPGDAGLCGQAGQGPRPARRFVHGAQHRSDRVVAQRAVPAGGLGFRLVEPVPHRAHQQPVQQAVQHDLPSGPARVELGVEVVAQRGAILVFRHDEHRRQRTQQPLRHPTPDVVHPDQQHEAVGVVRAHRVDHPGLAAPDVPQFPGLEARPGLGGEDERCRPAYGGRLADPDQARLVALRVGDPALAPHWDTECQRGAVGEPQRPRRRQHRPAEGRAVGVQAAQQIVERVHAPTLDRRGWTADDRTCLAYDRTCPARGWAS